jgi:acyl carrier protein
MNTDEIEARAVEVLTRVAPDVTPGTLDPAINLRDQFDFDSMDFLNFALELGKEFAIEIPEIDYPKLSSLAGCTAYIEARLRAKV